MRRSPAQALCWLSLAACPAGLALTAVRYQPTVIYFPQLGMATPWQTYLPGVLFLAHVAVSVAVSMALGRLQPDRGLRSVARIGIVVWAGATFLFAGWVSLVIQVHSL